MALALGTEEDRLRQIARQLPVAAFDEDLGVRRIAHLVRRVVHRRCLVGVRSTAEPSLLNDSNVHADGRVVGRHPPAKGKQDSGVALHRKRASRRWIALGLALGSALARATRHSAASRLFLGEAERAPL
jgi:hypothetical protein